MSSGKFKELKIYLKALPETLPISTPFSKLIRLQNFVLDDDWVKDIGIEGAVNREIEAALGDFLPRNNDGIFYIKERGPAIEALADVLEHYHGPGCMLSGSPILKLWLDNAIASAKKCILTHGGKVSSIYSHRINCGRLTVSVKLPTLTTDSEKLSKTSSLAAKSASGSAKTKQSVSKLDTKELEDTEDSAYSSEEESDDDRRGGRKILGLLKEVSKPCHRKGETKKMARCLGSKGKH